MALCIGGPAEQGRKLLIHKFAVVFAAQDDLQSHFRRRVARLERLRPVSLAAGIGIALEQVVVETRQKGRGRNTEQNPVLQLFEKEICEAFDFTCSMESPRRTELAPEPAEAGHG